MLYSIYNIPDTNSDYFYKHVFHLPLPYNSLYPYDLHKTPENLQVTS